MIRDRPSEAAAAWRKTALRTARGVRVVAAVFCIAVAALLVQNAVQLYRTDPLNDPALQALRTSFDRGDASPELVESIRSLDLLARRAYFNSRRHIAQGGLLLAAGLVALLIASQIAAALDDRPPPRPTPNGPIAGGSPGTRADRTAVAAGAVVLLALAAAAAWTARSRFPVAPPAPPDAPHTAPEAARPTAPAETVPAPANDEERQRQWPAFRGPFGNGLAAPGTTAPAAWDATDGTGILWKTPLPRGGYGSPIVWGGHVFATGGDPSSRELFAVDASSGKLLWRRELGTLPNAPAELPTMFEQALFAAPTPATDGTRVFALFATGELGCFDFDGNRLWARHLGTPAIPYGHSSSPIVWRDRLLLQIDSNNAPRLVALRTADGADLWEAALDSASWASPVCVPREVGAPLLVVCTGKRVAAFDPTDGKALWEVPGIIGGEGGASPAFGSNTIVVSSANGVYALRPPAGDAPAATLWHWTDEPAGMPSPVVSGDLVFIVSDHGTVTCLKLADGEKVWTHDVEEECYASPLIANGRLFVSDRTGKTHIFAASAEFAALGRGTLDTEISATPALSGGRMFVKTVDALYGIGDPSHR